MTRLVLLFFSIISVWGVTASPDTITVYMRANGGLGQGLSATRSPKRTTITISGSGSWNLSRGGGLAGACNWVRPVARRCQRAAVQEPYISIGMDWAQIF